MDHTVKALERLPVTIYTSDDVACKKVAHDIAELIQSKGDTEKIVLGLATGSSPIKVYEELVRLHREEGLSFQNVITFNLDEYFPMQKDSILSYNHFMRYHLFDHIDIPKENIYIPDGSIQLENVNEFCSGYEKLIDQYGGIDIQLLGIGRTGHVGFNEPPSHADSLTRLVKLDPITISDARREFLHEELVPRRAITMGIKSIFKAKKIYLLAWGEKKSQIIQQAVEGPVTQEIPATFLQNHDNTEVLIDENASLELTRIKTPWMVTLVNWNESMARKAVIWMSQKLKKPILKLTEEDYKLNDLGDLLVYCGDSQSINLNVFTSLQNTITGWPGGKPGTDDTHRPERSLPVRKRAMIFSPHPDDDVISMGGTLIRLIDQGHDVHVAYQTSGNIAVFDEDVIRFAEFACDFISEIGLEYKDRDKLCKEIVQGMQTKKQGDPDIPIVRAIKGLIRKGEATTAARFSGVEDDHIHFLNMPFYETGTIEKKELSAKDVSLVKDILNEVRPHQVFAAGDLRDPHGTHKICLDALLAALRELKSENANWINGCYLWLYRGAWQEWAIEEIHMAIPLSPSDLLRKRKAIFKHQSQKDTPVFPGSDEREFWQRAEFRNRETAEMYDQLGLTEYEAMEAFVRYSF